MVTLPIPLPFGYSLKIQPGDTVHTGDVLAEKEALGEIAINIPTVLRIPIKHSAKALRKNPGDAIEKGTILAAKKRTFGINEDIVVSQVDATFLRYERDTGTIIVIPQAKNDKPTTGVEAIYSPIDGIVEVCDNGLPADATHQALQAGLPAHSSLSLRAHPSESKTDRQGKILLRTDKDVIVGKEGIGKDFTGSVLNILQGQEDPERRVQLHFLDSKIISAIIIGGVFDRDSLLKAIGLGVGGIVAFSIREEDLEYIQKRHLTTPIVTVEKVDYIRLLSWESKRVYIQGGQKTILLLHL